MTCIYTYIYACVYMYVYMYMLEVPHPKLPSSRGLRRVRPTSWPSRSSLAIILKIISIIMLLWLCFPCIAPKTLKAAPRSSGLCVVKSRRCEGTSSESTRHRSMRRPRCDGLTSRDLVSRFFKMTLILALDFTRALQPKVLRPRAIIRARRQAKDLC